MIILTVQTDVKQFQEQLCLGHGQTPATEKQTVGLRGSESSTFVSRTLKTRPVYLSYCIQLIPGSTPPPTRVHVTLSWLEQQCKLKTNEWL